MISAQPAGMPRCDVVETTAFSSCETSDTRQPRPSPNAPSPRVAHQRRPSAGADTSATTTSPSRSSASRVAHTGLPRT